MYIDPLKKKDLLSFKHPRMTTTWWHHQVTSSKMSCPNNKRKVAECAWLLSFVQAGLSRTF